ncbi:MAG: hypothetical protein IK014_05195 [Lachnospiraceae bacterium]|nr:hypothetical protein [Lachnospiraceae bacterium]
MDKLYWVLGYIKVFFVYFFIMYLWPSVVFKRHLKKKQSKVYKFVFCSVVQLILINTMVLGLGLIGIMRPVSFNILFYGLFLFFLFRDTRVPKKTIDNLKHLASGTYGIKTLFSDLGKYIRRKIIEIKNRIKVFVNGNWAEYIMLLVLVVFGLIYFSVNAIQENSYGFGDLYTHHSWIYNLVNGQIFSSGIYPEAMHCLIAAEHCAFGIPIYNALLFTGPVFSSIIIISIYIMFKELFKWKWSPMLATALLLVTDARCFYIAQGMARWQWTMPQEYGFPAMFFCLTYLIRFFKNKNVYEKSKVPLFLRDDNLFLFTFSVASTIAAHFYSTFMAVMLCLAGACILIIRFFSKKFISFLIACLAGLIIAVVPMLVAFAEGYHFQGSIRWAMSYILSDEQMEALFGPGGATSHSSEEVVEESDEDQKESLQLRDRIDLVYRNAYVVLHGKERALIFIFMTQIVMGIWAAVRIIVFICRKAKPDYPFYGNQFDGYVVIVLASVLFTVTFSLTSIGLPQIIEPYRVGIISHIMGLALLIVPVDAIGALILDLIKKDITGPVVTFILLVGIYIGAKVGGFFHGYLGIELTRYNSTVRVTDAILDKMGKGADNFTIISSTDEYYQIIGYGFHEELVSFVNKTEEATYTIPTEYLFIYIEKNAIARAQYHLANGPEWLAENKYYDYYKDHGITNVEPEVAKVTISKDYSELYFGKFPEVFAVYNIPWARTVLNSKLFAWCQKFNAMYPNELHVFFEDDDILIYYLRQNPRNLYELATMDPTFMLPPESYSNPIWPKNYYDSLNITE